MNLTLLNYPGFNIYVYAFFVYKFSASGTFFVSCFYDMLSKIIFLVCTNSALSIFWLSGHAQNNWKRGSGETMTIPNDILLFPRSLVFSCFVNGHSTRILKVSYCICSIFVVHFKWQFVLSTFYFIGNAYRIAVWMYYWKIGKRNGNSGEKSVHENKSLNFFLNAFWIYVVFIYLFVYLCVCLFMCLFIYVFVYLFVFIYFIYYLFVCLFIYVFGSLFVCLFVCLFIYVFGYLFVYLLIY